MVRGVYFETHGDGARRLVNVRIDKGQLAMERLVRECACRGSCRDIAVGDLALMGLANRQELEIVLIDLRLNPDRAEIRHLVERRSFLDVLTLLNVLPNYVSGDRRANR